MQPVILTFREKAVSQFHLAHVQSLLRATDSGHATNEIPAQAEQTYRDRVRGHVTVALPGGEISTARAFEALCAAELPERHLAHAVLNGATHWFPCSAEEPCTCSSTPRYRAYFRHDGHWLFFFTQDAPLPFGSVVSFSKSSARDI
ncbi:hypothetical protein [Paraburkholderia monticola]|jgi:hypothetical protein|uniref:hypothetical protein n=1 Tax=Paraburkholderia monticola TaxID=1399968 RepID=UPI000783D18B|nr:hypothetical protein [Paraburkholderia monticola]